MYSRSQLEIFPDELFLELFSYINPDDLYNTWLALNRRFRAILRSVRISFDLFYDTRPHLDALNYFSSQIVFIHFHTSCPSLDFKGLPNLRTLISDVPLTKEQFDSIRPSILPYLRRLTFSTHLPEPEILNDIILKNNSNEIHSFRWIEVYQLPRLPSYLIKNASKLNHIHSLVIDRVTTFDIDLILSTFIYLRRLKVTVVPRTGEKLKIPMKMSDVNYQHHHLTYLNITMNTCDKLDDFFPLLSRLASLKSLFIACDSLILNDFQQLAFELQTRVPWLKRFDCSFQQTYVDDMNKLRSLSPFFRRMQCRKVEWCGGWYYYCVTTQHR